MTVKSGQTITGQFATVDATGAYVAPTVGPIGTLVIDGVDNAAVVTVTNLAVGKYKFAVTCPVLTAGQLVQVHMLATISGVSCPGYVFRDLADTFIVSDVKAETATILTGTTLNTMILSPVGGTTTGNGAVDGTTVLDTGRTEPTGHWNGLSVEITSSTYLGQTRTVEAYTQGVGFTFAKGFGGQILTGVTYRVISAIIYQPGISVVKNYPTAVEPDTLCNMGIAIVTNAGQPTVGNMTPGVIGINRIRAGVSTLIVAWAACLELMGNIYYSYTFPSTDWEAGDLYEATLAGQKVTVNGITYDLAVILLQGRVSREAVADGKLDAIPTSASAPDLE